MYETQTQFAQQSTNDQQAKNVARKTRFDGQASQGQYPFAQQGSQQAQQSGAAAQGAALTNAQRAPAPQPTFSQLQAQGMARPAPPAPAPQPQQVAGQMGQLQQAMVPMLSGQPPQNMDAQRMAAQQQLQGQGAMGFAAATGPGYNMDGVMPQGQQVQPTGNAVPFSGQGQLSGQMSPAFGAAQGQTGQPANVQAALAQMLANPSAYNTDAVMGTYQRLSGQIDDDFNQRDTRINEEMARRGIYDSSIAGGRLADSNIARRSASVELADRLAQQQAEKFDQARQAAVGLGLTNQNQMFQDSQFNSDLGYRRDSLAQNDRQFGAEFGQRQYEFDGNMGFKQDELAQNGMTDFLKLLGSDVVDYGDPAGTAQWQGTDPVTR